MKDIINLTKGQVINLSKISSIDLSKGGKGLHKVKVGLGWDSVSQIQAQTQSQKKGFLKSLFSLISDEVSSASQLDIDCDAFALQLNNGVMKSSERSRNLFYYGNLGEKTSAIYHTGDNLTGDGDGDDEQIILDLDKVSGEIIKIGVTIYRGKEKCQHFGMLQNAFIRIVDCDSNTELCRFNLDKKYDNEVSLWFGELVKLNNEWSFTALGTIAKGRTIEDAANEFTVS